jgi:hypothetical protein
LPNVCHDTVSFLCLGILIVTNWNVNDYFSVENRQHDYSLFLTCNDVLYQLCHRTCFPKFML